MEEVIDYGEIVRRDDGSYVIRKDGGPYHVPNEGQWAELYESVHAYAEANPDKVKSQESEYLLSYSSPEAVFFDRVKSILREFADKKGYDSILSARLASGPFAQDKVFADKAYNDVWSVAISLWPSVRDGAVPLEKALTMLPTPKWS